jgi:hypothetical protein
LIATGPHEDVGAGLAAVGPDEVVADVLGCDFLAGVVLVLEGAIGSENGDGPEVPKSCGPTRTDTMLLLVLSFSAKIFPVPETGMRRVLLAY